MSALDGFLNELDRMASEGLTDEEVRKFIESMLFVRPKQGSALVPFKFNRVQEIYWKQKTNRDQIVKGRQVGVSTLTLGEFFARCVLLPNQMAAFVASTTEQAERIFRTARLFYDKLPAWKKRELSGNKNVSPHSKREIYFPENNSRLVVATAGAPDAIRGVTLNMVHLSEHAFYDDLEEFLSAIMPAVPADGIVRMETTPNLAASYAFEEYQRGMAGESMFKAVFLPWWEMTDYRLPDAVPISEYTAEEDEIARAYGLDGHQIAWHRATAKVQRDKMKREYPFDPMDCWLHSGETVFNIQRIRECWAKDVPDPATATADLLGAGERWLISMDECLSRVKQRHKFVVGVDPAEGTPNGDYSAIIAFDQTTGDQVYAAHLRIPLYQFAGLVASLGISLGNALLVVERNNHGHAVLQRLIYDIGYPNLYYAPDDQPGVHTSEREKALLIDEMDRALWNRSVTLRDPATFHHLRTYVYDERRKAGASPGAHDDLVSALLCANRGVGQRITQLKYGEVAYPLPKPDDLQRLAGLGIAPGGAAGPVVWFKTGAQQGQGPAVVPFTPDSAYPWMPVFSSVQQAPWSCPSCGKTTLALRGTHASCAGCGSPATTVDVAAAYRRRPAGVR